VVASRTVSDGPPNVFADGWERDVSHGPFELRGRRVGAAAGSERLGAGVFELAAGKANLPYHAHHGIEELLVVLSGRPTLRTPEGEQELVAGDVVSFRAGPQGAHQLINRTTAAVRYLMVSTSATADVIEYPDSGKVGALGGTWGEPGALAHMFSTAAQVGYFDGEDGSGEPTR
jgi:uncharacterized cupin superfamily protein